MTVQGDASISGSTLILTPDSGSKGGAAYETSPFRIGTGTSFSSTFTFQLNSEAETHPADGFTFVIAANTSQLGGKGGGLGYDGATNSVAVSFDTFDNGALDGNSNNHVGVLTNGSQHQVTYGNVYGQTCDNTAPVGCSLNSGYLSNGDVWSATVNYDGSDLSVSVRDVTAGLSDYSVISNYAIDIPSILNATTAYAGFTASTGSDHESHDVLSWNLTTTIPDIVGATNNLSDLASLFNARFDGGTLIVDGVGATSSADYTITANGGSIDTHGNNGTFSGNITDATGSPGGRLIVENSGSGGALTLSGTNNFTGGLRIDSGAEVSIASSAALGSGTLQLNGTAVTAAVLDVTGNTTIANNINLAGAAVFNVATGVTATLTGAITDLGGTPGALVVNGAGSTTGVLVLNPTRPGTNTYSGGTFVQGGTLRAGAANVLPTSGAVTVDSGATFDLNNYAQQIGSLAGAGHVTLGTATLTTGGGGTFSGDVAGSGGVTVTGGVATLSGTNTYTGATLISGGTLALNGTGSIATSSAVTDNATFDISATTSGATIKSLAGSGAVTLGAQTLTMSNASGAYSGTFSGNGGLTIAGGTETLSGNSTSFTGAVVVDAGATLSINAAAALGSASLALVGLPTLAATLSVTSSTTIANAISVTGDPIFNTSSGQTTTISSAISGTGEVVAAGAGTLLLTAANTYTGATIVNAGATLALSGAGAIATSSGLTNNGTFDITGVSGNVSLTGSGAATYTQASTGTLKMTGAPVTFQKLSVAGAVVLGGTLNEQVTSGAYTAGRYLVVSGSSLTGKFASLTTNLGSYTSLHYSMAYDATGAYLVLGADPGTTLSQLTKFEGTARGLLTQGAATIANSLSYDCAAFDTNGVCVSFQARYSTRDAMNSGAGVLTGAVRLQSGFRVGAFVDATAAATQAAGTKVQNTLPTMGGFVGYAQNADGRGVQARLSASYNSAFATLTRDATFADSEAGSGKARLTTLGVAGEIAYGVAVTDKAVATPFVGLRHTDALRGGYDENRVSGTVDLPVSYDAFAQRATTVTAGLRFNAPLTDAISLRLGLGTEYDLASDTSRFSGTSAIGGLTSFDILGPAMAHRLRPMAEFGMSYAIDRTQTLSANATVRGQAFSNQPNVNVMAGYQVAF